MPEQCAFEAEMAIETLKRLKSLGIYQIPAEFIKAGVEQFVLKSINSISNEEELPEQWNKSILVPTHTNGDKTH